MSRDVPISRAAELARFATTETAHRITPMGKGIPTSTHEVLRALASTGVGDDGTMGETFIRLDRAVVEDLVKIAGAGRTPESIVGLEKSIRDLVGGYLYPVLAHREDGDFIITATDGERGNQ